MLVSCWSVKGGSGTTVVAASLALLFAAQAAHDPDAASAAQGRGGALLADLAGDVPAVLGLPEPDGDGLLDWLSADVSIAALARLERDGGRHLAVLPRGRGGVPRNVHEGERIAQLSAAWGTAARPVVADLGLLTNRLHPLAAGATTSLLVLRPCYVALKRAVEAPLRPSGVVLVDEPARALGRYDIEEVLGVPVVAVVDFDPGVARAVDAGLLAARLPRQLARGLRTAA